MIPGTASLPLQHPGFTDFSLLPGCFASFLGPQFFHLPLHSMRLLRLMVVLPLLALGCRSTRPPAPAVAPGYPNHTLREILAHLHPLPDSVTAFTASATLSVQAPERSGQFNARIDHRRDDSLYLSLRATVLNVEAARFLLTPDSFFVYNRIEQQLVYGPVSFADTFLPIPLAAANLFPTLLGQNLPDTSVAWAVQAEAGRYILHDATRRYVIDPLPWQVVHYQQYDASGTILDEREYAAFEPVENLMLPRRIVLRRPAEEVVAALFYRNLRLNPPTLSFRLRVGTGVERVPVETLRRP
jgi:hypothetical protein